MHELHLHWGADHVGGTLTASHGCTMPVPTDWEQHCPIQESASPVEREAWRKGWMHRKSPSEETALDVTGPPLLLYLWLEVS